MAQLETKQVRVYAQTFQLTNGTVAAVAPGASFNGTSEVLGIVRTIAAGTPGVPVANVVVPGAPGATAVWKLGVFSSSATDNSTYTVYYVNNYIPSSYYSQIGSGALVQFAP